jgi:tRNA pseudouridine38/39 synthase
MSDSLHAQLFEMLFPGEGPLTADRHHHLAAHLRELADEVAAQPTALAKSQRLLDFSLYQQRYVALEVLYVGHDYHGFAKQENADATIEAAFFTALRKVRLIPPDVHWQDLKYSRGGRTDKGVSALGNTVALVLRSAGRADGPPVSEDQEYDYPALINRALPPEIRVLGWTTVPADFSARFSACHREYKYFLVDDGTLNLDAMRAAAAHFVGEHDFRNLCKPDVTAVKTFVRIIREVRLEEVAALAAGRRRVLELYIRGTAFLWHQVRCMVAILTMVGRGLEEPGVVATLLDVEATPRKPNYLMASEEPLLLYSCGYPDLSFRRSERAQRAILEGLDEAASSHLTRMAILCSMEQRVAGDNMQTEENEAKRLKSMPPHVPLFKRSLGATIEELQVRRAHIIAAKDEKYAAVRAAGAEAGKGDGEEGD